MNSASISLIWQQHIINATQPCLYDFFFCLLWVGIMIVVCDMYCMFPEKNSRLYKVYNQGVSGITETVFSNINKFWSDFVLC